MRPSMRARPDIPWSPPRSRGSGGCTAIRTTPLRSIDGPTPPLNVGLVGFGFAGKVFHAPVIRAVGGLRLTTIVQRHGAPDPHLADVEFVRSVEDLLSRPLDLVVVATSNTRSEEHTSELQSHVNLVCRLLLEKKKKNYINVTSLINSKQNKR